MLEDIGYLSYDVSLQDNRRFVMPADLRKAFKNGGKFVMFSDTVTRTLTITDEKTYNSICEQEEDDEVLMTFNAREYDPKDAQSRGSFSESQLKLLGISREIDNDGKVVYSPNYVIFHGMGKYIVVSGPEPDAIKTDGENQRMKMKNVKKILRGGGM